MAAPSYTFSPLYQVSSGSTGKLVLDGAGDLFGATYDDAGGTGQIFEVVHTGNAYAGKVLTTVDGGMFGGLTLDAAGNLFGVTQEGGAAGDGSVFEVPASQTAPTTLASFTDTNGHFPDAAPVRDDAGNLFGTTFGGGAESDGGVYEVAAGSGTASLLASFPDTDGGGSVGQLVMDSAGDIFGTTTGEYNSAKTGTIFEYVAAIKSIVTGPTLVGETYAGLVSDAAGNLYGTTYTGGANGDGTVFEYVPGAQIGTGQVETLAAFNGTNGSRAYGGLTLDAAGDIFGTTATGGANNDGTVFEIPKGGTLQTLYSFTGAQVGSADAGVGEIYGGTAAGVTLDKNGDLFGVTLNGIVFELTLTQPTIAKGGYATTDVEGQTASAQAPGALTGDAANNGGTLTITAVQTAGGTMGTVGSALSGSYGSLTLNSDGSYSYAPNSAEIDAAKKGLPRPVDDFDFTVSNGAAQQQESFTVTIDRPPMVVAQNVTVQEGGTVSGSALTGDSDPDGDPLSISAFTYDGQTHVVPPNYQIVIDTNYGSFSLNSQGAYSYEANSNIVTTTQTHPIDTVVVTVSDGDGGTTNEPLSSTINRPPTVVAETGTTLAGATSNVSAANGALAGDSDPDGDSFSITSVSAGGTTDTIAANGQATIAGTYGSLTLGSDGTYSYAATNGPAIVTAPDGSPIVDTFGFNVSDGNGGTTPSSLKETVSLATGGTETVNDPTGAATFSIGATTLTLTTDQATTFGGIIQDGSSGNTGGMVVVEASYGALTLSGANTFTGGVMLAKGTLELDSASASGGTTGTAAAGSVAYAASADATLQIDAAALSDTNYARAVSGFALGDVLDLRDLAYQSDDLASLSGTTLTVGDATTRQTLSEFSLASGQNPYFVVSSDGYGGTDVTLEMQPSAPTVTVKPNPLAYGQSTTISGNGDANGGTATIYDEAANAPAGTQPTLIGTVPVSGGEFAYTTSALPDGTDDITATYTSQGGDTPSPMSSPAKVTVTANAPTNLMQTDTPAINGGAISVSGQAQDGPDDTVTIAIQRADGTGPISTGTASVTPGKNGNPNTFTYTSSQTFADGNYTITATDTSADGTQTSAPASTNAEVLPSTPTVSQKNEPVYEGPIELTGTGEAGDTLNVTIDDAPVKVVNTTGGGAGTVGPNGTYDVTTTMAYTQGQHPVSVTETDSQDLTSEQATTNATVLPADSPTIAGLANSTTNLQDPTHPFASATVEDPTTGATDSVTIALSGAAGTLSGSGLTANPDGTYTLGSATPATLTQELDALAFTPSPANGGPIEATNFALTVTSSTTASSTASVTSTIDSYPNQPLFGSSTTSPSSVGGQVYALYQTILGRAPDPLGFETQVAAVNAGASLQSVAQGLLTSAEYANDYGSTVASNSAFINQLYEDGLHRPADAGGQQLFGDQLANGTSRAEVAVEIATSPESSNDLAPTFANGVFVPDASDSMVARLYYGLLNRAPDAGGLQADENVVHSGESIGQLIQGFLGSAEYQGTTVGQDNLGYIEGLYQSALGRQGDAAGLQLYENGLDTGALSRANVADDFLTSSEFQSDEAGQSNASYVNTVYEAALGRAADPDGSTYWQTQLNDGVSRSQVAQDIVGSSEFASKYTAAGQAEFVQALYEGALGRAPAASETQAWQAQLSNGASLANVAAGIIESPEATNHLAPKIEAGYHIV